MKDDLKGKVFLVTGSGTGLGAVLATAAARAGARVVLNCRHDTKRAEALAADLKKAGSEACAVKADVTAAEGARQLVEEATKAFGRVDVLVNTVGAFEWKTVAEMDPGEWRAVMASNLDSVYHVSRLVLPGMREHRFGRIVNFGEVGAERTAAHPRVAAWAAAKAGVVAFSKALALEEARYGITVNVVCPGVLEEKGPPGRARRAGRQRRPGRPHPGGPRRPSRRRGAGGDVLRLPRRRLRDRPGPGRGGRRAHL